MRDELGAIYSDADFAPLYSAVGQPAFSPWRLALVTVMQFVENLSDRQAADAVRGRIDWKYALSLELTDAGFDYSVLSEFRQRMSHNGAEQRLLDRTLELLREKKLLKARGRQRTDSTHVLAAVREMNRLELMAETLRATLNVLATVAPEWLQNFAPPEWYQRYANRVEGSRLPRGGKARQEYAEQVGRDGADLLEWLRQHRPEMEQLPAVVTLHQVWQRHFMHTISYEDIPDNDTPHGSLGDQPGGEPNDVPLERVTIEEDYLRRERVALLPESVLGRAATAVESPYDVQARHSNKHDLSWLGYKVHLSETCDPGLPRLVTHVHTTVATTQDVSCTATIHQSLAAKDLLPQLHLVDTGYVDAQLLVESQADYGIELFGPPRLNPSWQTREGGLDISHFSLDWQSQQATCPQGKTSVYWQRFETKPYGRPIIKVCFSKHHCTPCPQRAQCVRSVSGQPRHLNVPDQPFFAALEEARQRITTGEGRALYRQRAGVEGALSQAVRRCGLRRTRYRGLAKTHLQHLATAAALNVVRSVEHLNAKPLAQTRTSRFARLAPQFAT